MDKGKTGESYHICGPVHSFIEAFKLAEQITGLPAPRLYASPQLLKLSAALMSVVERVVDVPETYTAEGLRVIAGVTYIASHEKARQELGYLPRSLEDGLRETLEHEMKLLEIAPRA
jgi:dihydroflavonol-4-reductase